MRDRHRDRDRDRDRYIYKVLFYLAVDYKSEDSNKTEEQRINFLSTSHRLGYGKKSDYAKRIYDFIKAKTTQYKPPAYLTTEQLVERIKGIQEALEKDYQSTDSRKTPKILRKEDIIRLFGHLISLTSEEKYDLGLTDCEANTISQQALLNIGRYQNQDQQEAILDLYKASLNLTRSDNTFPESQVSGEKELKDLISEFTKSYFDFLGLKNWRTENKLEKQKQICRRINRHILRLKSQAGIPEGATDKFKIGQQSQETYLTNDFLKRLIISTIENQLIQDSIPLYFQHLTIDQLDPLPLYYPESQYNKYPEGLLNPEIIEPETIPDNRGLASQHAYKISVSFNLKIEDQKLLEEIKNNLTPEIKASLMKKGKGGLVFSVTSFGVSGQTPQLIKVINRALLWDIKCLRKLYFSIAHDLVIHQEVINNNVASPVWAHSLVKLCRLDYLQQALEEEKSYDQCCHIDEIATGDYCGFNLIEAVAKSTLQARLAAILKTNINPSQYIEDLSKTITQREKLKVAQNYLYYYPFSLSAMKSYLQSHLLRDEDQENGDNLSNLQYDGYLSIITGYLREGMYRKAYEYLHKLQKLEQFSPTSLSKQEVKMSGILLVKYEICKAFYFYLCNEKDQDKNYQWEGLNQYNRTKFITEAWKSLEKAEEHLKIRRAKYTAIKEISQSIFSPHFSLLGRINFLRAKICLFFPSYTQYVFPLYNNSHKIDFGDNYHYAGIYFLERSRIYAAKNGDTLAYACDTAYQVLGYIMVGYLVNKKVTSPIENTKSVDFTRKNCLYWAKILRDNALTSYAKFGRECYYQIKEKSGISIDKVYGNLCIESLPLIREERIDKNSHYEERKKKQGYKDAILHIDMSLLHMTTLDNDDEELEEHIYLFGAKAVIILFARAMYELCSDENIASINKWREKLSKAYRLFTYAWAIAEDGCKTDKEQSCGKNSCGQPYEYKMTRPHFNQESESDYPPPEAKSLRDLYPHRQSEMADLGKVYAIACNLLLLYITENQDSKNRLETDIRDLIVNFQDHSRTSSELMLGQPTFNAHLRPYLDRIESFVEEELKTISQNTHLPNPTGMNNIRNRIMCKFFQSFSG